ncbi:siderophore iron transporter [Apiospora arundinis]
MTSNLFASARRDDTDMELPTSEPEKSGQWTIEERRDSRNGTPPLHSFSHHGLSTSRVVPGKKLWTPERASWATWLLSSFAITIPGL